MTWQFEEDIIDICFEILNKSLYFLEDPSKDYSQRNDVVYVCRVVSAMVRTGPPPTPPCLPSSEVKEGAPPQPNIGENHLFVLCRSTAMMTVACFRGTGEKTTRRG